ncbi:MAG: DUF2169 domain-containing protein [Herbaspirillum sp.]
MKILTPDSLALLYRSCRLARQSYLAIGMLGFFNLNIDAAAGPLPETELWPAVAATLGEAGILDEGLPKPSAEFLVFGSAHAPTGTSVQQLAITVQLGTLRKSLLVHGDRHFNLAGLISTPQPFIRMPLDPSTAFGGAESLDNPLGKGLVKIQQQDGSSVWPLPNVEFGNKLIANRGDIAPPAGFWPYPANAPQRSRHLGQFDTQWLKKTWPHLPDETDAQFFNTAPEDQRMNGFFHGDEAIVVTNMHPQQPRIESTLPGLRARCFINRRVGTNEEFSELTARAETVWLFPELERGIILYRAITLVADEDAEDILHIMAEWEPLASTALPLEQYYQQFREQIPKAVDPAQSVTAPATPPLLSAGKLAGIAVAASAATLVPAVSLGSATTTNSVAPSAAPQPNPSPAAVPELEEVQRLAGELQQHTQKLMQQHGITEADLAPYLQQAPAGPIPSVEDVQKMAAELEQHTQKLMQEHNLTDKDLQAYLPPPEPESAHSDIDLKRLLLELDAHTQKTMQDAGITQADLQAFMRSKPEFAEMANSMPLPGQLAAELNQLPILAAPLVFAAAVPKVAPINLSTPDVKQDQPPAAHKLTRDQVVAQHALGQSFAKYDLSDLDLSDLDLTSADFSNAVLEKTNFSNAQLNGVNFSHALLAGANLAGAILDKSQLVGASASATDFSQAKLEGCDATDADFTGANFSAAILTGARLNRTVFERANMATLQAVGCQADQASFAEAELSKANFTQASLNTANFSQAKLCQANFTKARCEKSELYGADATQAIFAGANLNASRAGADSCFDGAQFTDAQLIRANWEGASLAGANLEHTLLDHADFSRIKATKASFEHASAKGANFDKADLIGANLSQVNLFKGSLRHAKVAQVSLQLANLYGVDFYGTNPTRISLEGSNIDRTLLQLQQTMV